MPCVPEVGHVLLFFLECSLFYENVIAFSTSGPEYQQLFYGVNWGKNIFTVQHIILYYRNSIMRRGKKYWNLLISLDSDHFYNS